MPDRHAGHPDVHVFLVPLLSLCERSKLNGGPRGLLSHAEQRGNMEPSGRRHPAVADPSAGSVRGGVWEPEGLVWSPSVYFFLLNAPLCIFFNIKAITMVIIIIKVVFWWSWKCDDVS